MNWLFRKRIDRNQWQSEFQSLIESYRSQMLWTWDETAQQAPAYFQRLKFSVGQARGRVLEIGSGIGNMTRWLADSPEVESILAVDAFPEAINELLTYRLPKVVGRLAAANNLTLGSEERFNTVMLCEVIEHLYPDEELALLRAISPHLERDAKYVLSTPVGFMADPHHVRGFSRLEFLQHLDKLYGLDARICGRVPAWVTSQVYDKA